MTVPKAGPIFHFASLCRCFAHVVSERDICCSCIYSCLLLTVIRKREQFKPFLLNFIVRTDYGLAHCVKNKQTNKHKTRVLLHLHISFSSFFLQRKQFPVFDDIHLYVIICMYMFYFDSFLMTACILPFISIFVSDFDASWFLPVSSCQHCPRLFSLLFPCPLVEIVLLSLCFCFIIVSSWWFLLGCLI